MTAEDAFVFRPARPGDGRAMRLLARSAYEPYVARIGREPAPMTTDYEALPATSDVLLAWCGDVLAGMVITELEKYALLIENIAVAPQQQGKGLGTQLLAHAEQLAHSATRPYLRLYTNEAMTENIASYLRRGFVETHRSTEDGYRRVYFTKHLT